MNKIQKIKLKMLNIVNKINTELISDYCYVIYDNDEYSRIIIAKKNGKVIFEKTIQNLPYMDIKGIKTNIMMEYSTILFQNRIDKMIKKEGVIFG